MEALEVQVKSADEAAEAAAKQLGVTVKDIKVKVVEESAGLFGKKKLKLQIERVEAKAAKPKATKAKAGKEEEAPEVEAEVEEEKPAKPARAAKAAKPAKEEKTEKPAAKGRAKKEEAPADGDGEKGESDVVAT